MYVIFFTVSGTEIFLLAERGDTETAALPNGCK